MFLPGNVRRVDVLDQGQPAAARLADPTRRGAARNSVVSRRRSVARRRTPRRTRGSSGAKAATCEFGSFHKTLPA